MPEGRRRVRQITPKLDERSVGIGFVDVLFALVMGQILASVNWNVLHSADWAGLFSRPHPHIANLLVATVVTLASWIGYHNSVNRPRFKIRFINWPLLQFVVDIVLVLDYWLLATLAGGSAGVPPSSRLTAFLVFLAFLLYCFWDLISFLIGRQRKYQELIQPPEDRWPGYNLRRNATTWLCALLILIAWQVDAHINESTASIYLLDIAIIGVVVGFRIAKDSKFDLPSSHRSVRPGTAP